MKSFKYTACETSGSKKEGLTQANSPNDVIAWLRERGLTPVSIQEIVEAVKQSPKKQTRKRIRSADVAALCWQLTTMVEGGIPITTGLETISNDIENLYLQEVLRTILDKMRKGENFSGGIAMFPKVFDQLSRAIIMAGETSGNLPGALKRVAEHFDSRDRLARKIKGAMAYPIFVLVFIVLIVVFIMAFIIPRFRAIFDQFGGQLPGFTRAFMGFYDFIVHNIIFIIASVVLVSCSAVFFGKSPKGHYIYSKIALRFPLMGKILSQGFVAIFCKTMATLLSAGVSVLEVFDILQTMTKNDIIKDAIVRGREHIVQGSSVSMGLASAGFFPNMVVKMVQVGEESGSLPQVLERTSDYYERKVDATISTVLGLLEPIMIVTVGGIVLIVILALYLPIFSMSANAG
ncbi:MAG: type II secretion system F family protein [Sedimentisphaerales bacterium]|nr:type II secretion system F family protein [Sedimentisphaerales bacterium]